METFTPSWNGWGYWTTDLDVDIVVEFRDNDDGRLVITGLVLGASSHPLDANLLRRLPIGRLEQWVNADESIAEALRRSWVGSNPMRFNQLPAVLPGQGRLPLNHSKLKLTVPRARPFGDDFYESVAIAHRAASIAGVRGPAKLIAETNKVTVTQVHRWVKVAREKGLLGAGRVGKS